MLVFFCVSFPPPFFSWTRFKFYDLLDGHPMPIPSDGFMPGMQAVIGENNAGLLRKCGRKFLRLWIYKYEYIGRLTDR